MFLVNKKFASLEGDVSAKPSCRQRLRPLLEPLRGRIISKSFYAQNQLIDITYIQKLSTFFKYYNILKRKKGCSDNTTSF